MRLQIGGIDVRLGSLVMEMQGEVVAVQMKTPQAKEGKTPVPYYELAVQQKTGTFSMQAFGEKPQLEEDEKYIFTVSVENDGYGQAKQPRLQYLAHRPFTKLPTVPMPTAEGGHGAASGPVLREDKIK